MGTAAASFKSIHSHCFGGMIGESHELRNLWYLVDMVARTDSAVLIQGETGTGKELLAKAIHEESLRSRGPFVKVNCSAIPAGLLESELFGHERGAFAGALSQSIGRFERGHRGTLFLDEIGDLPLELQPKLLCALQEKEFERLGNSLAVHVDIRFIAATNQDLCGVVQESRFRADLFYRLNVFPVGIPPLRARRADIPALVYHFVEKFAGSLNKVISNIPNDTMDILQKHNWPGNIRELQNLIERAVIMSPGSELRLPPIESRLSIQPSFAITTGTLIEAERDHILKVLAEAGGVVGGPRGAATGLGPTKNKLGLQDAQVGDRQRTDQAIFAAPVDVGPP